MRRSIEPRTRRGRSSARLGFTEREEREEQDAHHDEHPPHVRDTMRQRRLEEYRDADRDAHRDERLEVGDAPPRGLDDGVLQTVRDVRAGIEEAIEPSRHRRRR